MIEFDFSELVFFRWKYSFGYLPIHYFLPMVAGVQRSSAILIDINQLKHGVPIWGKNDGLYHSHSSIPITSDIFS